MGIRGKKVNERKRQEVIQLRKTYGVNYISKHVGLSKSEIYKIIRQERERPLHFAELSRTALMLADVLDHYRENYTGITPYVYPEGLKQVPLGTFLSSISSSDRGPALEMVKISNLFYHLKADIPELAEISDWSNLTPGEITKELVLEIRRRGNKGEFYGKCPDCPR